LSRLEALRNREITTTGIPKERVGELRPEEGIGVYEIPQPYLLYLPYNQRHGMGGFRGEGGQAGAFGRRRQDTDSRRCPSRARTGGNTHQPQWSEWYADEEVVRFGEGDTYGPEGARGRWTMRKHLLPNVSNSVITAASLLIPGFILFEAELASLGLGDPTVPSWGQVIADGHDGLARAWWISTLPGFFLFFTILAFNFVGDALRDALDPRQGVGE